MPHVILVGFSTRIIPGYTPSLEGFEPPANYKNEEAIARWREKKAQDLLAEARLQPYTATFDEVHVHDCGTRKTALWRYRDVESGRQPVALAVRQWLLDTHPDTWSNHVSPPREDAAPAVFVGFDAKLFLRMLATECSLPANQPVNEQGERDLNFTSCLPLSMWMAPGCVRDIASFAKPAEFTCLSWRDVFKARGMNLDSYWSAPHDDAARDLVITSILATQLGLIWEEHLPVE